MKVHKKLVRDKIPQIIAADGKKANIRILNDDEYLKELIKKLKEEASEFEADNSAEELADIYELVISIRERIGVDAEDLENIRSAKAVKNGRFKDKIFLESVEK